MPYLRTLFVLLVGWVVLPVMGQGPVGGALDAGFGTGGQVSLALGAYDLVPTDAVVGGDGAIYVLATREYAGAVPRYRQVVVKMTSAGLLDAGFGVGGAVELVAAGDVQCGRLHLLGDGSLRVVAASGTMRCWGLDAAGAVLAGYGVGGVVDTGRAVSCVTGSALLGDGGLLLLGYEDGTAGVAARSYVVRVTVAAVVDVTFGSNGVVTLGDGAVDSFGRVLRVLSGGLFLVGVDHGEGLASGLVGRGCSLLRFSAAGVLDDGFSDNEGVAVAGLTRLLGMEVNGANGRITLLGRLGLQRGLQVVRCLGDGAVDHTFSEDGVSSVSAGTVSDGPAGLALISDGSCYVGNTVGGPGGTDFQLLRLGADGERDLSFNSTGDVVTAVGAGLESVSGLRLQGDGKLLLYGAAELTVGAGLRQPVLVRYWPGAVGGVSALGFTTPPVGGTVAAGAGLSLSAVMNVSHAGLYFQWKRDGVVVAGGYGLASLQISTATVGDEGSYTVAVRDGTSEVVSAAVAVVVQAPPVFLLQPVGQTVVAGSYASFSLAVSGRAPFDYTVRRDGSSVATGSSTTGVLLYEPVLGGSYTFTLSNADGVVTSDAAVLTLLPNPPTVLEEPVSVAVVTGSDCSFTVTAEGLSPYTFQWMKDGADVGSAVTQAGATHTLSLTGVTGLQQGAYQCRISNLGGAVTTRVAWLDVGAEGGLRVMPGDELVAEGAALRLRSALFTADTGAFPRQWARNGLTLADTGADFLRSAAALTDAGSYRSAVVLPLPAGRVLSNTVRVAVVGSAARTVVVAQGRNAVLSVRTAGSGLRYAWQKNGSPLAAGPGVAGVASAALSLTGVKVGDTGLYSCLVSAPWGQTVSSGVQSLAVVATVPMVTTTGLPAGRVGTAYSFAIQATASATRYTAAGLPVGLVCDAATGVISGAPSMAGTFTVRLLASNPLGNSAVVPVVLTVAGPPASLAGEYSGLIGDGVSVAPLGSYVLRITPNGLYTGKATLGAHTGSVVVLAFHGQLVEATLGTGLYESDSSSMALPSFMPGGAGAHVMRLSLDLASLQLQGALVRLASGPVPLGKKLSRDVTPLSSYRNPWNATTRPAGRHALYYTATLRYPGLDGAAGGTGVGYCGITAELGGTYTLMGRLPEGTPFTSSGIFNETGGLWLQCWLYQNRGSVAGQLDLVNDAETSYTDSRVAGQLYWTRPADALAAAYPVMGNALHTGVKNVGLLVQGARYLPPDTPHMASPLMMNLPPNPLLAAPQAAVRLLVDATQGDEGVVDAGHKVSFSGLTTDAFQPRTLVFTPATGVFTGTVFYQPANRSFPVSGVVVSDSYLRVARAEGALLEGYSQAVTGAAGGSRVLSLQQTRRVDFLKKP